MRIESLPLERYPFCTRLQMSKQKKKKKLGENWMVIHSIEVYCSGLPSNRNGFIRFQFNSSFSLVYIEFLVRSSSSSAYMIAPKADPVRLESKRMKSLWQLQYFTTLTPSGLTRQIRRLFPWRYMEFIPKNASSNKGGGGLRCLKCLSEFLIKIILNVLQSTNITRSVHLTADVYHCLSNAVYLTISD